MIALEGDHMFCELELPNDLFVFNYLVCYKYYTNEQPKHYLNDLIKKKADVKWALHSYISSSVLFLHSAQLWYNETYSLGRFNICHNYKKSFPCYFIQSNLIIDLCCCSDLLNVVCFNRSV